jgi:small conductance mechanosensitive channel
MNWLNHIWSGVTKYFTNKEMWETFTDHIISIIFIVIITFIVIRVGRSMLRKIFKARHSSPLRLTERRETTLERLVENVFSYVVYFVAVLMILEQFIDVKGLIAGAGVAGLAIGFGAQNLVKDVITGFFIIFEDQFSVGDYVRIGSFEGYVEQIGLRTTKIVSWTGELYILPNSSINEVTNYSINNSIAVVDIKVAYEEDVEKAEAAIEEVMEEMAVNYPEMVRPPEILGVQMLGTSDVMIRVIAETLPMEHWHIGREIRKAVKQRFDEKKIRAPYPKLVTYRRDEAEEIEVENMRER